MTKYVYIDKYITSYNVYDVMCKGTLFHETVNIIFERTAFDVSVFAVRKVT